ncbi:hypothetical protein EU245_10580 [Lentibacillus lipolyticus]|nr:hypothetical protein EU245_10580 [Lentibacillus lipolyticus]
MRKDKAKVGWGVLIVFLILSAYVIPYTLLSGVDAWYGSFLLWGMIGALVIIANIMVTKDWGK